MSKWLDRVKQKNVKTGVWGTDTLDTLAKNPTVSSVSVPYPAAFAKKMFLQTDEIQGANDETLPADKPCHDLHPANDSASIIVECWTPSGIRRLVYADSHEHAEWIRASNPKPPMVTCADCSHAAIGNGIALCSAGVDSGLPAGGFWATDRHHCQQFEAKP